jgi:2-polyprenyl-3-methyl-5-hydroxy-6-metoxy-1,4-benzoquinol methylase
MMASADKDSGSPAPSDLKSAVRAYWDEHVQDWKIARHAPGTREFFAETEDYRFEKLDYLPRRVQFSGFPGKTVLDVGCGLGNDLSRFARGGSIVTGVDLSPRAIELARLNFAQRGLNGTFAIMDGEALDFPEESFDVVYCHTVLHFTPAPGRMVREIHRVLRTDGLAILMTVNRKSWMNWLRHVMKVEIDYLDSPVFRHMDVAEFRALLEPFADVSLVPERFPVPTRVHGGLKAALYNALFVGGFNALPRTWTRSTGHHLLAFCRKARVG